MLTNLFQASNKCQSASLTGGKALESSTTAMLENEEIREGVVIIRLSGYLVASNPVALRQLIEFGRRRRANRVIIDLRNVRYIDSRGLTTIYTVVTTCRSLGGDAKLAGMQQHIRQPFLHLRLDKQIDLFPSPEEALQSFSG